MSFIRRISTALESIAARMQGQDVERHNTVKDNRLGGDYAAVMHAHHSHGGITSMGFGR